MGRARLLRHQAQKQRKSQYAKAKGPGGGPITVSGESRWFVNVGFDQRCDILPSSNFPAASGLCCFQDHFLPRKSVVEAELKKESLKSPQNSSTGMLDLARGALRTISDTLFHDSTCQDNQQTSMVPILILARSFFRSKSRVVPEIVEFDEVCMP